MAQARDPRHLTQSHIEYQSQEFSSERKPRMEDAWAMCYVRGEVGQATYPQQMMKTCMCPKVQKHTSQYLKP